MKLNPGEAAPDFTFGRGGDGAQVALSELWRERPLVLAFLRHFG
jgi:peroxiredoxin